MDAILDELKRIYGDPPAEWDPQVLEDFEPNDVDWYKGLPDELRAIAEFIGYEEAFPHDKVRMLYGPADLIEWNSDEGTFGQLREVVADYRYDKVVMIGEDTYLDIAGQVKQPGAIVSAIGHELDDAEAVADSLLALLKQAGSYADGN